MTQGEAFELLVGELDYPMLVVTAVAGDERGGCLVGFATQASISPSRYAILISHRNHTHGVAIRARHLGVHFVSAEDEDLVELFGSETGDEIDKFARTPWRPGPEGVPLLDRCRNRFAGEILDRLDAGDHTLFLLKPVLAEHEHEVRPFPFHRAKRLDPGHEA